jgi:hypothetical protein
MIAALSSVNTKAVSLLEQGQHQDAIRMLSKIVRQCALALSYIPSDSSCNSGFATETIITPYHFKTDTATLPEDVFSHPFLLHFNDSPTSAVVFDDAMAAGAAVCLFNMGLACHMEWGRRRRNETRILQQAQAFYARSVAALQHLRIRTRDSLVVLRLAVYTNLISLSQEMGELQAVQCLKQDLAFVLSCAEQQQFYDSISLQYIYQASMLCKSDLVAARAA